MKSLVGRKVVCSHCSRRTTFGKIGILRKIMFLFCQDCWGTKSEACIRQMKAVAS
jgi:hypothetical protein